MLDILLLAAFAVIVVWFVIYFLFIKGALDKSSETKNMFIPKVDVRLFEQWLSAVDIQQKDFLAIKHEVKEKIVGMDELLHAMILNIFCGGHLLIEWVPGLAKTKTVRSFSEVLHMDFSRIQFTPDMLPSDILWTEIYNSKTKKFELQLGPVVSNIVLADEINRTTPKVQSALLEAMQEKQLTIWWKTVSLPDPFLVLATQNPLEQEGTYPLPEAQVDRFLFKVLVDYPVHADEILMLDKVVVTKEKPLKSKMTKRKFVTIGKKIDVVNVPVEVKEYITKLVQKTREKHRYLLYWASPRASIGLARAVKVLAFAEWRVEANFEDVQKLFLAVLRHRIILNYDAKSDEMSEDDILIEIAGQVRF